MSIKYISVISHLTLVANEPLDWGGLDDGYR